ncbi:hypothetical protein [uncultured Salinicola sp.]|uniref:hypothetical protein n=1 Tax=uncultured Salinicola sp. TaxID=1193542 RepID=UPI0026112B10|nr:hypothetical protein [uncultured Salinicola sp.]
MGMTGEAHEAREAFLPQDIRKVAAGTYEADLVREAFESGHAVDRIARTTYNPKKRLPLAPFGFGIGLVISLLGLMPVLKYLVEDGRSDMALVGLGMVMAGTVLHVFCMIVDGRQEKDDEASFLEHHGQVRQNLLSRFICEDGQMTGPRKTEETTNG